MASEKQSLVNSVNAVFGGFNKKQPKDDKQADIDAVAANVVEATIPLLTVFADIARNMRAISAHVAEQVTTMKEMTSDRRREQEAAERAAEEAVSERGTSNEFTSEDAVPAPESKQEPDACKCGEDEIAKDGETASFLSKFAGRNIKDVVKTFGSFIGESLVGLGLKVLPRLFPPLAIASLVAAVGYGIYKYFTDAEFQKTVNDAFSTAYDFVKNDVIGPVIESVKNLVTGAISYMGGIWEQIKGIAAEAWNWAAKKAAGIVEGVKEVGSTVAEGAKSAGKAVVSGAKSVASGVGSTVSGWFGGSSSTPTPTATPAPSPAPAPTKAATPAPAKPSPAPAAAPSAPSSPPPAPALAGGGASGGGSVVDATQSEAPVTGDASKLESVVNKQPGVLLAGLHATFKSRLAGMAEEFLKITGKKLQVNSGLRTREQQQTLYEEKRGIGVAKPGTSLHESGVAIDIQSADANKAASLGLLDKYKLIRPLLNWKVKPEPWHVEPVERKGLATAPDGNLVPGAGGKAVESNSGKAVASSPKTGENLAAASKVNEEALEDKKASGGTTIINNQKVVIAETKNSPVRVVEAKPSADRKLAS